MSYDGVAEIKLFKSVVLQAFQDATASLPKKPEAVPQPLFPKRRGAASTPEQRRWKASREKLAVYQNANRDRDVARNWLLEGGVDFVTVCRFAEWDPDYIRMKAKQLAYADWPSRADFKAAA